MQWDAGPGGGFSTGPAWLPVLDAAGRNVEEQRADPGSTLALVRELIALRRDLGEGFELLEAAPGVIAYRRGDARGGHQHHRRTPARAAGARRAAPGHGAGRDSGR